MSELDVLLKKINKDMKEDIAFKGLERKEFNRIPFSSPRMNYILYGGIARNTIVELCGEEASGKTTTALDLIKNYQHLEESKKVAYIDVENSLDEVWAERLGVNIDDLIVIRPQTQNTEQILTIIRELIETGEIGLVVLDSVAAMVPANVYEEDYDKKSYGGNALPLSRFVNQIASFLRKYDCTLILINQVREDLSSQYNQYITPGGKALKHSCSVRLMFRKGDLFDLQGNNVPNKYENPAGHKVMCSVLKTKICRWDRKLGFYTLNYMEGIDWVGDLIDCALKFNLINQAGAWFSVIDKQTGELKINSNNEPLKFQGLNKLITAVKEDEELKNYLWNEVDKLIKE